MWKSAGLPPRRISKGLFPTRWLWLGRFWTNHCHQRNVIKPGPELHEWEVGSVFLPLRLRVGRSSSLGNTSKQPWWVWGFYCRSGKKAWLWTGRSTWWAPFGWRFEGLHVWEVLHSSTASRDSDTGLLPQRGRGRGNSQGRGKSGRGFCGWAMSLRYKLLSLGQGAVTGSHDSVSFMAPGFILSVASRCWV